MANLEQKLECVKTYVADMLEVANEELKEMQVMPMHRGSEYKQYVKETQRMCQDILNILQGD